LDSLDTPDPGATGAGTAFLGMPALRGDHERRQGRRHPRPQATTSPWTR